MLLLIYFRHCDVRVADHRDAARQGSHGPHAQRHAARRENCAGDLHGPSLVGGGVLGARPHAPHHSLLESSAEGIPD